MFLRSENASQLTVFHEMVHLNYWYNKGPKVHYAIEEVIVFREIWNTKTRWTNEELIDSYNYVLDELRKNNLDKELTSFKNHYQAEIAQIKSLIQFGIK